MKNTFDEISRNREIRKAVTKERFVCLPLEGIELGSVSELGIHPAQKDVLVMSSCGAVEKIESAAQASVSLTDVLIAIRKQQAQQEHSLMFSMGIRDCQTVLFGAPKTIKPKKIFTACQVVDIVHVPYGTCFGGVTADKDGGYIVWNKINEKKLFQMADFLKKFVIP